MVGEAGWLIKLLLMVVLWLARQFFGWWRVYPAIHVMVEKKNISKSSKGVVFASFSEASTVLLVDSYSATVQLFGGPIHV